MAQAVDYTPARPHDAAVIARMSRDYVEQGLGWTWRTQRVAAQIRAPESMVLLAVGPGRRIRGFAIMHFGEVHGHLNLLAVHPAWRRQGIGRGLVRWLEQSARVAGLDRIGLQVRATNAGARRFYASLGFTRSNTVRGYYRGVESAVCMELALRRPCLPPPV